MSRLPDHFDLIIAISLPEREDRRAALRKNLSETGLCEANDIHWLTACRPDHAGGPPPGWTACKPAWGCLQSHLASLDLAMQRGAESVLILEDDAVFSRRAPQILSAFMQAVPRDWGQIYLGGNHALQPFATGHPFVWRAGGVSATHAYAVRGHTLPAVRARLADLTEYLTYKGWHCDSHLALSHARALWPAYAPTWWLAAQEDSVSDLNGKHWPRRWLHYSGWCMELPFILVEDAAALTAEEKAVLLFHDEPVPESIPGLLDWIHAAARRALTYGTLPAITGREAPALETLYRLWPAGIISHAGADLPALADYPFNGLFPHAMSAAAGGSVASRN